MSEISPLMGSILQSTQVQQRQSVDKDRHARRIQNLAKNSALQGDQLEHQVESADAPDPSHDQSRQNHQNRQPPKRQEELPHLDVTA